MISNLAKLCGTSTFELWWNWRDLGVTLYPFLQNYILEYNNLVSVSSGVHSISWNCYAKNQIKQTTCSLLLIFFSSKYIIWMNICLYVMINIFTACTIPIVWKPLRHGKSSDCDNRCLCVRPRALQVLQLWFVLLIIYNNSL